MGAVGSVARRAGVTDRLLVGYEVGSRRSRRLAYTRLQVRRRRPHIIYRGSKQGNFGFIFVSRSFRQNLTCKHRL